jgi:hypothetical protein
MWENSENVWKLLAICGSSGKDVEAYKIRAPDGC